MGQQTKDALDGDRGWIIGTWTGAVLIGVLTVPKLAFNESIGAPTPFLLYFAAIIGATYRGGVLAGLMTTVLSGLTAWFCFMDPNAPGVRELPALIVFSLEGLCISLVMGGFVVQKRNALQAANAAKNAQKERDLGTRLTVSP